MKTDKTLLLISLQLIICGLLNIQMVPRIKMSLFITLILITMYLFFSRIQFIQHRKSIDTKLSRVLKGNLQTRLFTSNDRSLHNIVFSINELIAELEKVRIEAKRSQESRKQLLSSISHDIRTPLTSIIGYIDALKDGVAASEIEKQEYLKVLYIKSNNLKHLVDDIFNMAKLDANEFPLKEEQLDFSEVTREILIEFLPELSKHNIELQVLIPESTCPIVADHLSLMRIMNNLIKNAIYYGKDGKTLGIELLETDTNYELLIWDKGPGISKHDLQNVFERMYRSEQSRNSSYGGSGLGLAIVKALVEKQHGHIWVESIPWERTTFGFSIPKHNAFKKQLRND
ncbi:HAMP domain-containing sensor histidine kinase [Bacillus sp. RA(2023)]|uniref:sensor histidine kinase n=1 Tax=Bacillus TaxID=1386 RepID=UPI0012FCA53D|nr:MULTISPECIES: HAMP domain-containing sensor histidine kinase [Bacillus]WPU75376.1 HAMP domain-containing sensor histidine kinase [Bacillus sp. RA(2023)]